MHTVIYMVRHAESPYSREQERTRGLSEKGSADAQEVAAILEREQIEMIVSSPYRRAVQTVEPLAKHLGLEIEIFEEFRERDLTGEDTVIEDYQFMEAIEQVFADPNYAYPDGESNLAAQERAVQVLKLVMSQHAGRRIAIGTHGNIMTLMMNDFDPAYGFEFWKQTTKPDIYKMTFEGFVLKNVERLWHAEL